MRRVSFTYIHMQGRFGKERICMQLEFGYITSSLEYLKLVANLTSCVSVTKLSHGHGRFFVCIR